MVCGSCPRLPPVQLGHFPMRTIFQRPDSSSTSVSLFEISTPLAKLFEIRYAIRYHIRRTILPSGRWFMPQQPVPADPGRDDDLAWLDRDPMTAEEREAYLDRVCEQDEPPGEEEYE